MGEVSKPRDDIAMGHGKGDASFVVFQVVRGYVIEQLSVQRDTSFLYCDIFRVFEWQVVNDSLDRRQRLVRSEFDSSQANFARFSVGRKGARCATVNVSGNLIGQYDERQSAQGRFTPLVKRTGAGVRNGVTESRPH